MATSTTNLSLRKPEGSDFVSVALDIAGNAQTIDDKWASSAPTAIGPALVNGSALTVARSDHVHNVGSGTVGSPGLPIGESNSGFYRIGSANIGATIAGALAWAFSATGIAIETALALKHVASVTAAAGYVKIFAKSDENLYKHTGAGDEVRILDADVFTAQGDLVYGTGAETFTQLAKGTGFQFLRMNTGATAPEWVSGGLHKIAEVSGTGASGVLEFSSIPATFRTLRLIVVGRSDTAATAANGRMTFETSPTAGAYDYQQQLSFATTVAGSEVLGTSDFIGVGFFPAASSTANLYGSATIELPEYANTSIFKPATVTVNGLTNLASGGLLFAQIAGVWESTAAIDRIRLTLSAGNWTTDSRATLYGIPG